MRKFLSPSGRVALATFGILALAACSAQAAPTNNTTATASAQISVEDLSQVFKGISFDYDPVKSNEEVARQTEIVAVGRIRGIEDGPEYGRFDDNFGDMQSVVLRIDDVEVVQGKLSPNSDGSIYLSVLSPFSIGAAEFTDKIPTGTAIVAYASASSSRGSIDARGWERGRPPGQELYSPHLQGLVIQTADDELFWPLTGVIRKGTLDDALPGGSAVGIEE